MDQAPYLSLVIPAYNEQENIPTLLSRVEAALSAMGKPFEVIIIDDGSNDSTPQLLSRSDAAASVASRVADGEKCRSKRGV